MTGRYLRSIFALIVMCTVTNMHAAPRTFTHTVAPGESISLICLHYYGRYSPRFNPVILKLNSGVQDVNTIVVGQELILPAPRSNDTNETAALQDTAIAVSHGVVTYAWGKIRWKKAGDQTWGPLAVNTLVNPGDRIETAENAKVEIIVNREIVVRMRGRSRIVLTHLQPPGDKAETSSIGIGFGNIWTKVKRVRDRISRFELNLPTAVAGVHGTVYNTAVAADSSAQINVYTGEVSVNGKKPSAPPPEGVHEVSGPQEVPGPHEVSMEEWTRIVRDMQRITIGTDGTPSAVEEFSRDSADSWEQWNTRRDQRIDSMFLHKVTDE